MVHEGETMVMRSNNTGGRVHYFDGR